jgi:amidase
MLETVGIMARSVAEIAEVTAAVAGPDGRDWRGAGAVPLARGPFRRRLACSAAPEVGPVDNEAAEAVRRVVRAAQAAGFETIDATGVLAGAFECYSELRAALDDHADLRRLVAGREGLLCPGTAAALSAPRPPAQHAGASSLAARWARARAATDRVTRLLRAVDALVVPVAASGPLPAGTAAGRPRPDNELMAHCRAVSLTGLPALSVPVTGPDRPVSVQVVGPPGGDLRCCEVAALIGDQLGQAWARPPVAPGG